MSKHPSVRTSSAGFTYHYNPLFHRRLHRIHGPAVIGPHGQCVDWYIDGYKLTEEEHREEVNRYYFQYNPNVYYPKLNISQDAINLWLEDKGWYSNITASTFPITLTPDRHIKECSLAIYAWSEDFTKESLTLRLMSKYTNIDIEIMIKELECLTEILENKQSFLKELR